MTEIQTRIHKLLILVGEEGEELQSRDYKKLSEVVVGQYLLESDPSIKSYLAEIIPKVVRGVPLKAHLYAALTAAISKQHLDLSNKIIDAVLQHLQNDLNSSKFSEGLNSINFLSETMNISFFNSLTLLNLFEDILVSIEKQAESTHRKTYSHLLVRALPLCAYSFHEKIPHEFKKYMQRIRRISQSEDIADLIYNQLTRGSLRDYSGMRRLEVNFADVQQIQIKFKLHLDLKSLKEKQTFVPQIYKWDNPIIDQLYLDYRRTEGALYRSQIQLLIDCFSSSSSILLLKLTNLIKSHKDGYFLKNMIEYLILRGLKSKNCIVYFTLLVQLKNANIAEQQARILEQLLYQLFQCAQNFELFVLLSFAKLFAFILNGWKGEFSWSRYLQDDQSFVKRHALLKVIFEKLILLNQKFIVPPALKLYEPSKPISSQQQYENADELQILQHFEGLLAKKTEAEVVIVSIDSERKYEIFLQALFRRTIQSQTHLNILEGRYHDILTKFSEWDWDLINKIRNFLKNSFFHRLLYLRFMIQRKVLAFASYVNYVGGLKNKSEIEMIMIKMELNQLNTQFGKTLRQKQ